MVVRKKKYQSGEASNFVTRKQALHKLQLNLKVSQIYHCHLRLIDQMQLITVLLPSFNLPFNTL